MAFSRFGRKLVSAHVFLILLSTIVLAFSTRANLFTEWFFKADLFPFGLSIMTIAVIGILLAIDCTMSNSYTGRAQFEFVILALLSLFWLGFSAFSTSRYRHVPYNCYSVIPSDQPNMRAWCADVQVVKAFIWIVWVYITALLLTVARYTQSEVSKGNRHVMQMPLSRYDPDVGESDISYPFAPGYGNTAFGGNGFEEKASNPKLFPYRANPDEPGFDTVVDYTSNVHQTASPPAHQHFEPESYGSGLSTGYMQRQYYAEESGYGNPPRSPHYQKTAATYGGVGY